MSLKELNWKENGCKYTMSEIEQQPKLWKKTLEIYKNHENELRCFLNELTKKHEQIRVIFTGAGTSEYVGNIVSSDLKNRDNFTFESIATTDLVSCPRQYYQKGVPTLLVSFARSGNSPESMAAIALGEKIVSDFYNLAITCAEDGKLAVQLKEDDDSFVLLMPEGSNDKGFAMTSSFTCMLLMALLVFDERINRENYVEELSVLGEYVLEHMDDIEKLTNFDFNRIVYLGSGSLYKLTNECRLKILELTAGAIVTLDESSMGFRHGPKSFVNNNTFIISLLSNDDYTVKYDKDILEEVYHDQEASKILSIGTEDMETKWNHFSIGGGKELPDVYLSLPYVIIAQLISVITSLRVNNTPDSPSKKGTVNRVVKGVCIHEL
ncbi:MAG: SIS domain-containing protein [Tissierellia bacterium]|nr:SIS domain-containing protein [Tissierellia bacterium]